MHEWRCKVKNLVPSTIFGFTESFFVNSESDNDSTSSSFFNNAFAENEMSSFNKDVCKFAIDHRRHLKVGLLNINSLHSKFEGN